MEGLLRRAFRRSTGTAVACRAGGSELGTAVTRGRHATNTTTLWTLVKDGDTIAATVRPLDGGAIELLSTLNGEVFYSRVFPGKRRFLKAAEGIRAMMGEQGWVALEPEQDAVRAVRPGAAESRAPASGVSAG